MRLRIGYQGGSVDDVNVQDPWKHFRWSLGVHLLANGDALIDNGVGNADKAGKVYVTSIEVDGRPMMAPGMHIIGPRALLPIRRSPLRRDIVVENHLPKARQAWNVNGDARAKLVSSAIARGAKRPELGFPFDAMGPWYPYGDEGDTRMQPGAVSGSGIEPLPGWERSSALRLQLADHTMHRMALGYCDVATGRPIAHANQPKYTGSRGRGKETSLAEFMQPDLASSNPDARVERPCNAGVCPYEATMLGFDFYNGATPYNDEHLVRGFRHALAGWQIWRDPLCGLYLDIIGNDAGLTWGNFPTLSRHQGVNWAGRACGWSLLAMKSAGHPGAGPLDRGLRESRMTASLHQRRGWPGPNASWGYAPDPWNQGYATHEQEITQSIEAAIVGYACSEPAEVAASLTQFGNPSHFMVVHPGSMAQLDLHAANERESFNVWFCWGKGLLNTTAAGAELLLARIPSMRLPDDGKQYRGPAELLVGMYANPHTQHLAVAIHALEALQP